MCKTQNKIQIQITEVYNSINQPSSTPTKLDKDSHISHIQQPKQDKDSHTIGHTQQQNILLLVLIAYEGLWKCPEGSERGGR